MAELTQEERGAVRAAAFGAMAMVSKSDPGFFAMFKESMAGSRALAAAPPEIRSLVVEGGMVMPPSAPGGDIEGAVMGQLSQAASVLAGKAPELLDGFKALVLAACDAVAEASQGVAPAEAAMIDRVKAALAGGPATASEGSPQDAPPQDGGDVLGSDG